MAKLRKKNRRILVEESAKGGKKGKEKNNGINKGEEQSDCKGGMIPRRERKIQRNRKK